MDIAEVRDLYMAARADHGRIVEVVQTTKDLGKDDRAFVLRAIANETKGRFRGFAAEYAKQSPPRKHSAAACPHKRPSAPHDCEHVFPVSIIHDLLLGTSKKAYGDPPPVESPEEVLAVLKKYLFHFWVTREEHRLLSGSTMPKGWKWGDDEEARYGVKRVVERFTVHASGECEHCRSVADAAESTQKRKRKE